MDPFVYSCLFVIVLITVFNIEFAIKRTERRIKRIEFSLSLILNRMELEIPSQLSERVKQLARDPARKIEAIKLCREETQMGLKEAKEAVEAFIDSECFL